MPAEHTPLPQKGDAFGVAIEGYAVKNITLDQQNNLRALYCDLRNSSSSPKMLLQFN